MEKSGLTGEEILRTGPWAVPEKDLPDSRQVFTWKGRTVREHGYFYWMVHQAWDGLTEIYEEDKNHVSEPLFVGYVRSIQDLETVIRLIDLHEKESDPHDKDHRDRA